MVHQNSMLKIVEDIKNKSANTKIATAESCTGGMLSAALTSIDGASNFFDRGFITYSNLAKRQMLDVEDEVLEEFGAVSIETAEQMAVGCLKNSGANLAISITGIAGPTGGTKQKPVGTVCFGVATNSDTKSYTCYFEGDRESIRNQACIKALEIIKANLG